MGRMHRPHVKFLLTVDATCYLMRLLKIASDIGAKDVLDSSYHSKVDSCERGR